MLSKLRPFGTSQPSNAGTEPSTNSTLPAYLPACTPACCCCSCRSKDALKAAVLDDTLTISGKRTKEKHEEGPGASKEGAKAPLRYERSYDIFSRSFWSAPQRGC